LEKNCNSIYRILALFILFFGISVHAFSQQSFIERIPDNYYLECRTGYGFLIPHHLELHELQTHFQSFELSVGYLSYGKQKWEYVYDFPRVGLSLWHSNFHNSEIIGDAYALHPYICFPWYGTPASRLTFRLGVGIGYLTKPYDPVTNYKNIAIGSHLNAAINLKLEYQHKLTDRLVVNGGVDFQHFSNGSFKTPNFGLNSPSVSVGFMYHPIKPNRFDRRKVLPELYMYEFDGKKFAYTALTYYMGIKDQSFRNGDKLLATAISAELVKPVNFKHNLGLGFDVAHYFPLSLESKDQHLTKYGICGAWHMKLWVVSFDFAMGVEIFKPDEIYLGSMYERAAFKYHFDNGMYTYFGLKALYGRADFIMFGVGYNVKMIYY